MPYPNFVRSGISLLLIPAYCSSLWWLPSFLSSSSTPFLREYSLTHELWLSQVSSRSLWYISAVCKEPYKIDVDMVIPEIYIKTVLSSSSASMSRALMEIKEVTASVTGMSSLEERIWRRTTRVVICIAILRVSEGRRWEKPHVHKKA